MVRKKFTATKTIKGRKYQYFRKDGKYIRLPDNPGSEEYDREYWRIMRGGGERVRRFTFDKLILSYKQSPKWDRLAPRTKKDYSKVLEYIHDTIGSKDPTKMRRSSVIEAQMANRHRARFANYIPHMLSILFEHAIDLDWQRDNPARGVAKLKTGEGYKPWPAPLIDRFAELADHETRLLLEIGIGTGQRIGDILDMKWSDIEDGGIHVIQNKTKTELWIPFTPRLAAYLSRTEKRGFYIATNPRGQKLSYNTAEQRFRAVRKMAGSEGYSMHGWRYTAATELADAGATDAQIAAITGHKSAEMVAKYSRKGNQRRLATDAQILRSQRTDKERTYHENGKQCGKPKNDVADK